MPYFARLNALRGYSVLGVFGFHAGVIDFGWVGVNAFFVLSGFLITGILIAGRNEARPGRFLASFYVRRCLRIVPAVYVYLLSIWAAGRLVEPLSPGSTDAFSASLPYLLTFTDNVHALRADYQNSDVFSHLWSLGVEEQFYLVWPLVILLTPRRRLAHACLAIMAVGLVFRTALWASDLSDHLRYFAAGRLPLASCDAFAMGGLLSIIRLPEAVRAPRTLLVSSTLVMLLGYLGEMSGRPGAQLDVWSLGWSPGPRGLGAEFWSGTVLALFFAHLIAVLTRPASKSLFDRLFDNLAARQIGHISYGFYIYHNPVVLIARVMGALDPSFRFAYLVLALPVTSLLAIGSYRYVERPFLSLKRFWPYRRDQQGAGRWQEFGSSVRSYAVSG